MSIPETEIILIHAGSELARKSLPPGDYIIGRSAEVEIFANTPLLSRRHARLTIHEDHFLLEDLGSSNGTFINEQPVTESTRLHSHESVRLGPDIVMEVRRQQIAPQAPPVRGAAAAELLQGNRYEVGEQVARGGMGAILQAEQAAMKRRVAMKVMLGENEEVDAERFIEEAQITGQLEHPNIVPVHELGVDDQGQLFYTMKLVRGITLQKVLDLLARGVEATVKKYPLPVLLTIFQKTCDAMAFAHNKHVIHRDLKPENIMLGDYGEVLVMDWGLAKVFGAPASVAAKLGRSFVVSARAHSGGSSQTMAGTVMGTPQYMAPEQARGEVDTLDARADIYALGAILFEILHLRASVTGTDAWGVVEKVKRGEIEWVAPTAAQSGAKPRPVRKKSPPPESLLAICRKALALDPAHRYARVDEFQEDIAAFQGGFATSAEKARWHKRVALAIKRNKVVSVASAVVAFAVIFFGTQAVMQGRRAARALADLKRNAPALLQLAATEASFQHFDSALDKLDGAIAIDPSVRPAYWERAWVLIGLERWAAAADALRVAQRKDPAHGSLAAIAPDLDVLASLPTDEARFSSTNLATVMDALERVGAAGERLHFAERAIMSAAKRQKIVQDRLDQWRSASAPKLRAELTGPLKWVTVRLTGSTVESLEPLRGLPIEVLTLNSKGLTSLEPLRGMALHELECAGTSISNLEPLRGMPLRRLVISSTKVTDLSPLQGMPLESLECQFVTATDIHALAGMPLKYLAWQNCPVADFSLLRGAPLQTLLLTGSQVGDFSFLKKAPVERLELSNNRTFSDLHQLAGLPIKELAIDGCSSIKDLRPLLELRSLEKLKIAGKRNELTVVRRHPSLQFIAANGPYRPVADYWAESDAVLSAGNGRNLRTLDLSESPEVTSLDFVRGLPLEVIDIRRTKVRDLSPLAGMKTLKVLRVAGCPIEDFSPLKGLALTELRIGTSKFSDLSLLEGMPLALLTLDNSEVTDVAPLAQFSTLRMLCIPQGAKNIDALRKLPQLSLLGYVFNSEKDTPDKTAVDFWQESDAIQRSAPK